jgi:hypothetical protein
MGKFYDRGGAELGKISNGCVYDRGGKELGRFDGNINEAAFAYIMFLQLRDGRL